MTFSSRSLKHSKGLLNHPKKGTKTCQAGNISPSNSLGLPDHGLKHLSFFLDGFYWRFHFINHLHLRSENSVPKKGRPKIKMIRSKTPGDFFFGRVTKPGIFRLEQIRIVEENLLEAQNQQENMSQKSNAGPLAAAFLRKIWGPGVQTQLSRCSNTAFAFRLDHFFLGTLPGNEMYTLSLEVSQKNSRS